jgi:hypothetical protein
MARNTSFLALVQRVRDESGRSNSVSVGVDDLDALKTLINRVYTTLWNKYDWPFLRTRFAKITVSAGQRYKDLPDDLDIERVEEAIVWYNDLAYKVEKGISPSDYAIWDPESDERSDPILRWDFLYVEEQDAEQVEVWPIPSVAHDLQFTGIRKVSRMVADADQCKLDDDLVVLYAVAELAKREGLKDADLKLAAANDHFNWLKSRYRATSQSLALGLGQDPQRRVLPRATVRISQGS